MSDLSSQPDCLARRLPDGAIDVRAGAVTVRITLSAASCADDSIVHGELRLRVAVASSPADRQLLFEELLQHPATAVTVVNVAEGLSAALQTAMAKSVAATPVDEVLRPEAVAALAKVLASDADRWAFRRGLIVYEPVLTLESPTVEARRRDARQARETERLNDLTARLKAGQGEHPQGAPSTLLANTSAEERAAILRAAMRTDTPAPSPRVVVVGGTTLVLIEVEETSREGAARVAVIATQPLNALGPLRSINTVESNRLAVGGRDGVLLLRQNEADGRFEILREFRCAHDGARGFSRALVDSGRLLACHGELGVIAWSLDDGREEHRWTGEALDLAQLDDGQIVVADRRAVRLIVGDATHELIRFGADLVGLVRDDSHPPRAHAVLVDGEIASFGVAAPTRRARLPIAGAVTAITGWPSPVGWRLVCSTELSSIQAVSLNDPFALPPYRSGAHAGFRIVRTAPGTLAAVSRDRNRLLVWRAWSETAVAELDVAAITRHRIVDFQIV